MFNKIAHQESNTETTIHSIDEIENAIELEPISETLIHGYGETHLIDDLANKIIEIAPSKNFRPLGIFQDKYSKELNFPTLFFGCNRPEDISNRLSYQQISQWELEEESTDFETHKTNIFFKAVKVIINQISNTAWISIRIGELKGKKLLAEDVKTKNNLEKILRSPISYRTLKSIRTLPDYFENMKKDLFAMIRQLGPPTFFVTFTSAEHLWVPLCNALYQIENKNLKEPLDSSKEDTIDSLIRRHPVICSRYYRHKITSLKSLILKNDNLFGKVEDFFFTTEFQQRGNEHEHGLLWIQNAPVYGQNTNAEITSFVDCYISTYSTLLNENFVKVQTHCHTRTCKKHKQSRCRFNFTLPPIDTTMVLEPLKNRPNCLIEN